MSINYAGMGDIKLAETPAVQAYQVTNSSYPLPADKIPSTYAAGVHEVGQQVASSMIGVKNEPMPPKQQAVGTNIAPTR